MRRRRAEKREILPDPKYNSLLVSKFINMVMKTGKKSIAETIVYGAMDILSKKTGNKNVLEAFQKAIDNTRPILEVRPRRIGGATYQVPMEVEKNRGNFMAMMWIRDFARTKKGHPMQEKLADETGRYA
jgi:small subunit ribosomal protein S7